MQVSKCEKFGYGVLVSQISSTKPGMQALHNTGLIRFFINTLWTALERDCPYGAADVELDDYGTRKAMSNLLKVFSSFHGLAILTALDDQEEEPNRNGLSFFLRCLVCVDGQHLTEPLVNQEESHQVTTNPSQPMHNSCQYKSPDWIESPQSDYVVTGLVFAHGSKVPFPTSIDEATTPSPNQEG